MPERVKSLSSKKMKLKNGKTVFLRQCQFNIQKKFKLKNAARCKIKVVKMPFGMPTALYQPSDCPYWIDAKANAVYTVAEETYKK